ncbi:MAG: hypothetical protein JXQ27_08035 [Acidobacteria bacterium]|nr:hypothetical protein [Acidobacteriota bacterium]
MPNPTLTRRTRSRWPRLALLGLMIAAGLWPAARAAAYHRAWDGLDPFHRPMPATNSYGSGDADNDGALTTTDLDLVYAMADGHLPASFRADVNADGRVDGADADLLAGALDGGRLPGDWNRLTGRAERLDWLRRILAVDPLNEFCYDPDWFVCTHFSTQLHIRAAGYGEDLGFGFFDGGQPLYNLPVYMVTSYGIGHVSNAVLVGDDPRQIGDWAFIEPITDEITPLGDHHLMTEIRIQIPTRIMVDRIERQNLIIFTHYETGWEAYVNESAIQLDRPPAPPPVAHGWDIRQPHLLTRAGGDLLAVRLGDEPAGPADIHSLGLGPPAPAAGRPFLDAPAARRLLDTGETDDGAWLLWAGLAGCTPGLFLTGPLHDASAKDDSTRVTDSKRPGLLDGRLVILPDDTLWVFWAEYYWRDYLRPTGIYGRHWDGLTWSEEMFLSTGDALTGISDRWRHLLDACVDPTGRLHLFWATMDGIRHRTWADDGWSNAATVPDTANASPAVVADAAGDLHLLVWDRAGIGPGPTPGRIWHRRRVAEEWQAPAEVSDGPTAGYPALAADGKGGVYTVWLESVDGRWAPCWRRWQDGTWQPPHWLEIPPGTTVADPDTAVLDTGVPAFTWLEVSDEACAVRPLLWYDLNEDGVMDAGDLATLSDQLTGAESPPAGSAVTRPLTVLDLLRLRLALAE